MIKLLNLKLYNTCDHCPYYDSTWSMCCEKNKEVEIDEEKGTLFPDWCPLETLEIE